MHIFCKQTPLLEEKELRLLLEIIIKRISVCMVSNSGPFSNVLCLFYEFVRAVSTNLTVGDILRFSTICLVSSEFLFSVNCIVQDKSSIVESIP